MHRPEVGSGELSRRHFLTAATGVAGAWAFPALAFGQEKKPAAKPGVEESIERGLHWLKKAQTEAGHWEAGGGRYKVAMTAFAGMAMLMEGSSLRQGKYTDQIRKAKDWLLAPARQQPNGLIADRQDGGQFDHYMHGHGYATMFLACASGECEDLEEQLAIEKALTKAVEFSAKAQTSRKHRLAEGREVEIGGWGYVSATERLFDEGSVTASQLQALRAAKMAAIRVPAETIHKAVKYLEACTTSRGGVIYSYASAGGQAVAGEERPPLTAAAICCGFSAGEYKSELPKRWIKYCKENIPVAKGRVPHDEYQNYYYAQFRYALGEERYGEMFPKEPKESWLTWSKYREVMFPYLLDQQGKDGSWSAGHISPVFGTAVNLAILQLERQQLPLYDR